MDALTERFRPPLCLRHFLFHAFTDGELLLELAIGVLTFLVEFLADDDEYGNLQWFDVV